MLIIGVTGGVGTGKSTVARMFAQKGARVLDADRITHELMRPGTFVWRGIVGAFGKGILKDQRIDRRRLGSLVFQNPQGLKRLTRIVHPAVRERIGEALKRIRRRDPKATVVLDIPLLMEAGLPRTFALSRSAYRRYSHGYDRGSVAKVRGGAYPCDALVVVAAPLAQVYRRLHRRSGWSLREIRRRQSFQWPLRRKARMADFVIRNGGSIASTRRQVKEVWNHIVVPGTFRVSGTFKRRS